MTDRTERAFWTKPWKRVGLAHAQKSTRWAFMERFEIPNLDHPDRLYLTRWRVIQTPWWSLYLHRMDGPDSRPTLHDHPWSFISFVLRGGYDEARLDKNSRQVLGRSVRRINVMRRDDAHYIASLHRTPTWTLLLVGARRRTWGYWRTVFGSGRGQWYWTPFDRDEHADEFDAAMTAERAERRHFWVNRHLDRDPAERWRRR